MNAESIITVSAAVVALVGLIKWMFGAVLPQPSPLIGPVAVLLCSLVGVIFWGWSQGDVTRASAFGYFSGFVLVMTSAAGVFGYTRATGDALTKMRSGIGDGQ